MGAARPRHGRKANSGGAAAIAASAAALLLLAGVYLWLLGGPAPPGMAMGGSWSLTRDDGVRVTDRDFRGRFLLLYFGYSSCPDVCPTTLEAVADAMRRLGPRGGRLQPLFVTVDPERDTASVLHNYVQNFGAGLIGLTGTPDELGRIERAFHIQSLRRSDGTPGRVSIDHTAVLLLLGPDGRYLAPLPADENGRQIAARLESYLS